LDDETEASGLGQIVPISEVDAVRTHELMISPSRRSRRGQGAEPRVTCGPLRSATTLPNGGS
jgi:hypothetical protein